MQEAPPRPPATPGAACPNCGAPVEPDQVSCLECGTILAAARRTAPSWRATVLGVAAALLVLGIGLGFLLRELTTEGQTTAARPAPTTPAPATTAPLPTEGGKGATEPAPDEPLPEAGAPESEPTPPPASDPSPPAPSGSAGGGQEPSSGSSSGRGSVASWPAGRSGFTVVLVSTPRRADARREAERAVSARLPGGLLRSNDFSSLNPGYWVAYAGEFDSRAQAARRAQSYAAQGFADAYPRRIEPAP